MIYFIPLLLLADPIAPNLHSLPAVHLVWNKAGTCGCTTTFSITYDDAPLDASAVGGFQSFLTSLGYTSGILQQTGHYTTHHYEELVVVEKSFPTVREVFEDDDAMYIEAALNKEMHTSTILTTIQTNCSSTPDFSGIDTVVNRAVLSISLGVTVTEISATTPVCQDCSEFVNELGDGCISDRPTVKNCQRVVAATICGIASVSAKADCEYDAGSVTDLVRYTLEKCTAFIPTQSNTPSPTNTASTSATRSITRSLTPSRTVTPSVSTSPTSSRTPSVSVTPTRSVTATSSVTPSQTVTPTSSRTPSVSVTPTSSVTPSSSVTTTSSRTPSVSVTPTSSVTPTASVTPSSSVTPTSSSSVTPTTSVTPSTSVSPTPSTSVTPTSSVTSSVTVTPSSSQTPSVSVTPTSSVTPSSSVTPTSSSSVTPTASVTPSSSVTPTSSTSVTPTASVTPSSSVTPTSSPSATPTTSVTPSTSVSPTPSTSVTPTSSETSSVTVTPSSSQTPSVSVTPTTSETPSSSVTPTSSPSVTPTSSETPSSSVTPTSSSSVTPTSSVTPSSSVTASASRTSSVTPSSSRTSSASPSSSRTPTRSSSSTRSPSPSATPTPSLGCVCEATMVVSYTADQELPVSAINDVQAFLASIGFASSAIQVAEPSTGHATTSHTVHVAPSPPVVPATPHHNGSSHEMGMSGMGMGMGTVHESMDAPTGMGTDSDVTVHEVSSHGMSKQTGFTVDLLVSVFTDCSAEPDFEGVASVTNLEALSISLGVDVSGIAFNDVTCLACSTLYQNIRDAGCPSRNPTPQFCQAVGSAILCTSNQSSAKQDCEFDLSTLDGLQEYSQRCDTTA